MRFGITAVAILTLVGCTDADRVNRLPAQSNFTVAGDYQTVFARTNKMLRTCMGSGGRFDVDGQVYRNLNYAELTQSDAFWGQQLAVRFEPRSANETSVQVKVASEMFPQMYAKRIQQWANGHSTCKMAR